MPWEARNFAQVAEEPPVAAAVEEIQELPEKEVAEEARLRIIKGL